MVRIRSALLGLLVVACARQAPDEVRPAPPEAPPAVRAARLRVEREEGRAARESGALLFAHIGGARRALVADEDDTALVEIDLDAGTILSATKLASRPRDLLVLADGRVAVTLPDAAAVAIVAREADGGWTEESRIPTPIEPMSMALSLDDATLWITTGVGHTLVGVAASTLTERARYSLGREPRAVLATQDRVFVTHAADTVVSVLEARADGGVVTPRDIGNRVLCGGGGDCAARRYARHGEAIVRTSDVGVVVPVAQSLPVPAPGASKRSLCPKPGSDRDPTVASGGYGFGAEDAGPPVITDLPTFDATKGTLVGAGIPGLGAPSCLLPRAAAASKDAVFVACLGSARVVRYTSTARHDLGAKKKASDDVYFSEGLMKTVGTEAIPVGQGPTGIAVSADDATLAVWSAFDRTVTRIALASKERRVTAVPRTRARDEGWLRGRSLFYTNDDPRIASDGRACASCHIDGRDDDLAWKTPKGTRRTRLLAGQASKPPFGWNGEHATLDVHVKSTIENLHGKGLPDDQRADLATYVASIPAPPSAPEEAEGKRVFAAADCAACHGPSGRESDRLPHDIGTGGAFVTPSLAGVGARRLVLHDGAKRSLDELLAKTPGMGRAAMLSDGDRRVLIRYLETL